MTGQPRTEWRLINDLYEGDPERRVLALDSKTGEMMVTQIDDLPYCRGIDHRNGFNTATHYLEGARLSPITSAGITQPILAG